ncbi:Alpha/Beta hydrolase protein [Flammula alnicola]|nr:Alpha/Beta hydrolase protein [Flammula alnicola]
MISQVILGLALHTIYAFAAPLSGPTVTLDGASFVGVTSGTTEKYLGIPFAQPPVGDLRYRLPQAIAYSNGTYDATAYGPSCGQQAITLPQLSGVVADAANYVINSVFGQIFPDAEDCLTINIVKPKTATSTSKLPVVVWIFGGKSDMNSLIMWFRARSTSMYDGGLIVGRSQTLGSPVVYVSMNYRLTGFGFLPGQEVKNAGVGNLGLQDPMPYRSQALRWFGGDPTKVTMYAIRRFPLLGRICWRHFRSLQMLANGGNTEGLFRGAFMESGAPIPKYYDAVVSATGCSGSADTLACLRTVPYATLKAAINQSPGIFDYQSLNLAWLPRTDGVFLTDNPQNLVQAGKVANIPFITGNCDDEGTLFSLANINITTDAQFKAYLKNTFLPGLNDTQVNQIATLYPADITQGSPFGTSILNALTPQFKRLAAFQGDGVFQAPRRWLLEHTASNQMSGLSVLNKRLKLIPILGSLHASDILNVYGGGDMGDHLIRFANNLNPNPTSGYQWPQYTLTDRKIAAYLDGLIPLATTQDTYRADAMSYLTQVTLENPV